MSIAQEYGAVAARYYDPAHGDLRGRHDVAFYGRLAREAGGAVLEVGCGTGRVLLPIARDGVACVGLDAHDAMLDVLRAKEPPANLRLVRAPMQGFDLGGERFALVYSAFRAFQHLYTVDDQLACLAAVRRHLAPGGRFAFDVFNPDLTRLAAHSEDITEDASFADGDDTIGRWIGIERDYATQVQQVTVRYLRTRAGRPLDTEEETFGMRWFFRFELEHLLARAGFAVEALYGDFDRRPFEGDSPEIVLVARAA
ncbi:MAG: class I SAM-dependent methyltransferase [bacterium]|nr:class I SAM-dependent methyltransferase [bacterium]